MIGTTNTTSGFDPFDDDDARPGNGPTGPGGAAHPNRLAALAGGTARRPPPRKPAQRTPAQREASRRNGSRGRGPTTAEGKARSRLNSLKHALLARVVCPPADVRGDDRLYRQIRRELVDELKPATFTERALVDALAADYLDLARARRLTEALQRPPALMPGDAERWAEFREARRDLRSADCALAKWELSGAPGCTADEAARLAARVAGQVGNVRDEVAAADAEQAAEAEDRSDDADAHPGADAAGVDEMFEMFKSLESFEDFDAPGGGEVGAEPGGETNDDNNNNNPGPQPSLDPAFLERLAADEREELRQLRELWEALRPFEHRLTDRGRVAAALAGRRRATGGEAKALRRALGDLAAGLRRFVDGRAGLAARVERANAQAAADLANAPEKLFLLRRYQSTIERAIERKLMRLGRD